MRRILGLLGITAAILLTTEYTYAQGVGFSSTITKVVTVQWAEGWKGGRDRAAADPQRLGDLFVGEVVEVPAPSQSVTARISSPRRAE